MQNKILHTGPFYSLIDFSMYDLHSLCQDAGLVTLVPFPSNHLNIDQLSIFLCYANLDSTGFWNPQVEKDWIRCSVSGVTARFTAKDIGDILQCYNTRTNINDIPNMRFKP